MPERVPLEADEGKVLVAYLRVKGYRFTHIPNETGQSPEARRRAIRMKQQGTSKGFPDYLVIKNNTLIVIELKRVRGSTISPEQREWLAALAACGIPCFIARGASEAIEAIESVGNETKKVNIDLKGFSGGIKRII
jgi:hypothetical protein